MAGSESDDGRSSYVESYKSDVLLPLVQQREAVGEKVSTVASYLEERQATIAGEGASDSEHRESVADVVRRLEDDDQSGSPAEGYFGTEAAYYATNDELADCLAMDNQSSFAHWKETFDDAGLVAPVERAKASATTETLNGFITPVLSWAGQVMTLQMAQLNSDIGEHYVAYLTAGPERDGRAAALYAQVAPFVEATEPRVTFDATGVVEPGDVDLTHHAEYVESGNPEERYDYVLAGTVSVDEVEDVHSIEARLRAYLYGLLFVPMVFKEQRQGVDDSVPRAIRSARRTFEQASDDPAGRGGHVLIEVVDVVVEVEPPDRVEFSAYAGVNNR